MVNKGHIPWNKGKNLTKKHKKKLSLANKGQIPWNKGLGTKQIKCKNCNKNFLVIKSIRISNKGKFCSRYCWCNYKYKLAKNLKLTPDLAELIGIIIGDGCINKYSNSNCYRITISGNKIEDKPYMDYYLPKLIKKCVGKNVKPYIAKNGAYVIHISSEYFRIFLSNLGIKPNKVKTVCIPDKIKKDKILLKRCIKGIADTDFTVIGANKQKNKNVYPRITGQFASENLVRDLEKALRSFGFTLNTMYNRKSNDKRGYKWITHSINLEGPHNLKKWLKEIGFANLRIITRYKYLLKFGCLPPKTTLLERLKMLGLAGGDD